MRGASREGSAAQRSQEPIGTSPRTASGPGTVWCPGPLRRARLPSSCRPLDEPHEQVNHGEHERDTPEQRTERVTAITVDRDDDQEHDGSGDHEQVQPVSDDVEQRLPFRFRSGCGVCSQCSSGTSTSQSGRGDQGSKRTASGHPRVRGADAFMTPTSSARAGPSPRARGRPAGPHPAVQLTGTIPACAGPTLVDLGVYSAKERFSFSLSWDG
jgi:hypothetical protein